MARKRNLTKASVVQTAATLADEKGLNFVTIGNIARSLQIKPASLYNHIKNLDEIHHELAGFAMHQLEEAIASACVGKEKADALKAIGVAHRQFAKEHPHWYKAYFDAGKLTDPKVDEALADIMRVFYQVLTPYNLPKDDSVHFIRSYRSALHGFVSLERAGYFQRASVDIEESYLQLINTFIAVLNQ